MLAISSIIRLLVAIIGYIPVYIYNLLYSRFYTRLFHHQ